MSNFPSSVNSAAMVRKVLERYSKSSFSGESRLCAYLNAVIYLRYDISQEEVERIFEDLAREYLEPSFIENLNQEQMAVLVKRVLTTKHKLLFSKPFRWDFKVTVDQLWNRASHCLEKGGLVLWGVDNRWLVIYEITKLQAFFFGGVGTNIINRNDFSSSINHSPYRYLKTVIFVRRLEVVYD